MQVSSSDGMIIIIKGQIMTNLQFGSFLAILKKYTFEVFNEYYEANILGEMGIIFWNSLFLKGKPDKHF